MLAALALRHGRTCGDRHEGEQAEEGVHNRVLHLSKSKGWRRWRILRPGRGMYHDVKRRLPYYWSDITDAFTYRVFASTVRMYFIK